MKFLVDANVLSEPTKSAPDARVVTWLSDHEGVTRNIRDFRTAGVRVLDPFAHRD
jgi:hypothetical protein